MKPTASPKTTESDVADFLSLPAAYPDPTSAVDLEETHISKVFLTDSFVYKLKKPVRFDFLDYGTVERRREACELEVRLNRRLAPGTYLGVVPITLEQDGGYAIGGQGEPIDYCVKMTRLPADRMLDILIRDGLATTDQIDRLLDILIPFYRNAARSPSIDEHASAPSIEANVRDNMKTLATTGHGLPASLFERVRASQMQYVRHHADLFARRIEQGWICEGHGDLRAEHVCMVDPPAVFDCVEFSLPFRASDTLSELAFLAMECDHLGVPGLAEHLHLRYQERAEDDAPDHLWSFYKAYRACVRAKVDVLRASQEGAQARRSDLRARRHLQLAGYYALGFYQPTLFVTVGASGTGKTTVADALANSMGLRVLSTDRIRGQVVGYRDPSVGYGEGIYADNATRRVYDEMFLRAEDLLRGAASLVLDGSFRNKALRERARHLAQEHGARIRFLHCRCSRETAMKRIRGRMENETNLSDARPEFYDRQLKELGTDREPDMIELDTSAPIRTVVNRIVEEDAE